MYHENVGPTEFGFWVEAKDLRECDVFIGANGELSVLLAAERIVLTDGIKVYNFTVDGNSNYFVIAEDNPFGQTCILVHNAINCGVDFLAPITYKGIKDAPNYPQGFTPTKSGTTYHNVNNGEVKAALQSVIQGKWKGMQRWNC